MVDFHTHVLPEIDDGSASVEESKKLLWESFSQGTDRLVATPHFYATESSFEHFLRKREQSIASLLETWEGEEKYPKVYIGAEVYFFPGISKAERLPELCIRGTNLLLLEMPFTQWTKAMYQEVEAIGRKRKLQVVLAHIERYYENQKDRSVWEAIWELPVYPQLNAGSFLKRSRKRLCISFLKKHDHILLGSDCHNMVYRPPNLSEARKVIEKKLGTNRLEETDAFAAGLLEKAEMLAV